MPDRTASLAGRAALITGAAQRIGATTARMLHSAGLDLTLHYRSSAADAQALAEALNAQRAESVQLLRADLLNTAELPGLVEKCVERWGRLDVLVNNASSFYPTALGSVTETEWQDLLGTNLKAPFFLTQAAAPHLREQHGCVINMVDIHAKRPLKGYPVYSIAKAGLVSMTRALARELGPEVRVNAVAPGAILWPERGMDEALRREIISRTALKRPGEPEDIARAILFLIRDALYTTGEVLVVDGGRSLGH